MRLASRPNDFPSEIIAQEHAQRMLAIAVRFAPKLQDAPLEGASIGWRPLPLDGHPVLGPAPARPDVYIAIMHSGVTLAPLAGRLAAEEVINGASHDLLSPYRADRQFSNVKRY